MRYFLLLNFLFIVSLTKAQVKHSIVTSGNTFSPNNITINVGDTVEWRNMGGTHNVNGTQATFPTNLESFGNAVGTGWTYTYVFNTAGTYAYRCNIHFGMGMVGAVTVQAATGILNLETLSYIASYPNPAKDFVYFKSEDKIETVTIYNIEGKEFNTTAIKNNNLDIRDLIAGIYFLKLKINNTYYFNKLVVE
jgi:plastocyanin